MECWSNGEWVFSSLHRSTTPLLRTRRRGFTLIELLVVIIIIAVISAVAVPSYARYYAHSRFQRALEETTGLLAWARDAAVQAGAEGTVRYDPQTETFVATIDPPDASADLPTDLQDSPALQTVSQPQDRAVALGEEFAITDFSAYGPTNGGAPLSNTGNSAPTEMHFHEDGTADGARFTVRSLDGYSAVIEISPTTGRAVVHDETE